MYGGRTTDETGGAPRPFRNGRETGGGMAALGLSRASRHSVRVPGGEGLGELQLDVLCAPAPSASSSPAILFYVLDPEPLLFGAASLFTYSSAGYFAALPTSAEQQFQRLHVVGVGHAASDVSANANGWDNAALRQLRRRDFPPFEHESIRAGRAANACAGRFASAVVDHVIPHVEGTLLGLHERPRRAILGASYSAVMALQIMLRHPQAFDDFVLGSPSVCFDPEILTLLQKISLKRVRLPPDQ